MGGYRNFGWGKQMEWAGKQALRAAFDDGHHATVASHGARWRRFCTWARERGVRDVRQITPTETAQFATNLRQQTDCGMSIGYAKNQLTSVNVTLESLRGDRRLWVRPGDFLGRRSGVCTQAPGGLEREPVKQGNASLEAQSRGRFVRFDEFIRNDVQVRLQDARRVYEQKVKGLRELVVSPEAAANNLKDLEDTTPDVVTEVRELLSRYKAILEQVRETLSNERETPQNRIDEGPIVVRLTEASDATKTAAEELGKPEGVQKQLAAVIARRAELELLAQIKKSRQGIIMEIARLKEREALENAKSAAATTGITRKILELSEESITEVVRDSFTRETDRLRLERLTIARTRADKGALLHQPKLVGARQQVTLPRVFSEGERTALGLAAFFTEAQLDRSKSALILDDPVTSLDHIRRGLVATRLAALAENRQVILFTHDVAFVADLKREAGAKGVLVAERSVTRSRADERKPGSCTKAHPWKAKDVPARLNDLRQQIAQIRRECSTWDEKAYDEAVALWAGNLSETWERIFSQEIVGPVLAEGGLEVRPMMVKVLARFSDEDHREFEVSYSRASQWAKRHDKSVAINYVAPDVDELDEELGRVDAWFKRVGGYKHDRRA